MTATLIQSPDRVVLPNISWQSYQSLIRDFAQEPAMRLTYDLTYRLFTLGRLLLVRRTPLLYPYAEW